LIAMATPHSVEVLPTPEGATLASLTIEHPFLGCYVNDTLPIATARHVHAPQIYIYICPSTGLRYAFEATPRIPGDYFAPSFFPDNG